MSQLREDFRCATKNPLWLLLGVLILVILVECAQSQTVYGVTGLLDIPTAEVIEEMSFTIGAGFNRDTFHNTFSDQWTVFMIVGFLPRMEVGLRLAGMPQLAVSPRPDYDFSYNIDRSVTLKGLVLKESRFIPSLAVGIQDAFGTSRHYASFYFAASKRFNLYLLGRFVLHVGYGTRWWDNVASIAAAYRYQGLFGGIDIPFTRYFSLYSEYDAQFFYLGTKITITSFLQTSVSISDQHNVRAVVCGKVSL